MKNYVYLSMPKASNDAVLNNLLAVVPHVIEIAFEKLCAYRDLLDSGV